MSTSPRPFHLSKLSGEEIVLNRTIKVIIGDAERPFVVLVTDRDYLDDPGGQTQTIVFRESYDSVDDATAEAKIQVNLSLADGFLLRDDSSSYPPF
jgi:hypothetical protein